MPTRRDRSHLACCACPASTSTGTTVAPPEVATSWHTRHLLNIARTAVARPDLNVLALMGCAGSAHGRAPRRSEAGIRVRPPSELIAGRPHAPEQRGCPALRGTSVKVRCCARVRWGETRSPSLPRRGTRTRCQSPAGSATRCSQPALPALRRAPTASEGPAARVSQSSGCVRGGRSACPLGARCGCTTPLAYDVGAQTRRPDILIDAAVAAAYRDYARERRDATCCSATSLSSRRSGPRRLPTGRRSDRMANLARGRSIPIAALGLLLRHRGPENWTEVARLYERRLVALGNPAGDDDQPRPPKGSGLLWRR